MAESVSDNVELVVVDGDLPDTTVATLFLPVDSTHVMPVIAVKSNDAYKFPGVQLPAGSSVKVVLSVGDKAVGRTLTTGLDGRTGTLRWPLDPIEREDLVGPELSTVHYLGAVAIVGIIYYWHRH